MALFTMPKFGMTMEEGTIARWLKAPGDRIEPGEILLEIESDKALMEVPCDLGGTVVRLLAVEGQTLKCGEPIAEISG